MDISGPWENESPGHRHMVKSMATVAMALFILITFLV
jgi:hypothetical protein